MLSIGVSIGSLLPALSNSNSLVQKSKYLVPVSDLGTSATVPSPPQGLTATWHGGGDYVVLNWSAPASNGGSSINEYKIYRGTSPGGESFWGYNYGTGTTITQTDSSITAGTTYYYYVTAVNNVGESSASNEASSGQCGTVPSSPQGLTATWHGGGDYVVLNWSAPVSNGGWSNNEYKIYRGTSPGGESFWGYNYGTGTTITQIDSSMTAGTTYYYYVIAVNNAGASSASNEASSGQCGTVPSSPQGLTATWHGGGDYVVLNWSAPASNGGWSINEYKIYRGTSPGGESFWGYNYGTGTTITQTDSSMTAGTTYYYYVIAVNNAGESSSSNEVEICAGTCIGNPGSSGGGDYGGAVAGVILGIAGFFGLVIVYKVYKNKQTRTYVPSSQQTVKFTPKPAATQRSTVKPAAKTSTFTDLLARAQEFAQKANQEFSYGNYKNAVTAWETSLSMYEKATRKATTSDDKAKIKESMKNITVNMGNAKISEASVYSKKGQEYHAKKQFTESKNAYQKAIDINTAALAYINQHGDIEFPVDIGFITQKNKNYELKLEQLEIEEISSNADNKVEKGEKLQKDDSYLSNASIEITEALNLYNQAKLKAREKPEFQKLESAIQTKMTRAREIQVKIQDRMDNLLGIIPTTAVVIEDQDAEGQSIDASSTITPVEEGSAYKALHVIREYEYIGGQIRFKIGLVNNTGGVLTDLAIAFNLPPALKWVVHEPAYVRKGDTVVIPKLAVGSKESVSLYLEPINCMDSPIDASITFFDSLNRHQAITMEPKQVTITCPIFFTREEANLARVKALKRKMKHVDKKILPVLDDEHLDVVFSTVLNVVGMHDVKLVSKDFDMNERFGEAWFYGVTKVKKNPMIIYLAISGENHGIELEVSGDDQEAITGLLAELEARMREDFLTGHLMQSSDAFYDIKTSVLLGNCPYCGGPLAPEQVEKFKTGEAVTCKYCDKTISSY